MKHILFVDDEMRILDGLRRMLRSKQEEWQCEFVTDVDTAWKELSGGNFDAVVSDLNMPGRTGIDLLHQIRQDPDKERMPFLMLSGNGESSKRHEALQAGATDFLNKPCEFIELEARLTNILAMKQYQDEVKEMNSFLEQRVQARTAELEHTRKEIVLRLAMASETRDTDTGRHILRVGTFSKILADGLGMSERDQEILFLASTLHDVGKIGISDNVLLKPGKLTDEERQIMQMHCLIGYRILAAPPSAALEEHMMLSGEDSNELLDLASKIARSHHEWWDGTGYPDKLRGPDIPLPARIVAVADVYDALRSPRPYKLPFSEQKTYSIIMEGARTQFDPAVLQAFENRRWQMAEVYDSLADEILTEAA